jgi:hypothetical protein
LVPLLLQPRFEALAELVQAHAQRGVPGSCRPIRHGSHRRTDTDNLLVRCVLDFSLTFPWNWKWQWQIEAQAGPTGP